MTVQYRIIHGKKDEHIIGPDDADVVVSIEAADTAMDPNVAYMRGKLKMVGHTGKFFDALKSGEVAVALKTARS
jgi:hypothetical protein